MSRVNDIASSGTKLSQFDAIAHTPAAHPSQKPFETIAPPYSQSSNCSAAREVVIMANIMNAIKVMLLSPNIRKPGICNQVKTEAQEIIDMLNESMFRLLELNDGLVEAEKNLPQLRQLDGTREVYALLKSAIAVWERRMPTLPPKHDEEHDLFVKLSSFYHANVPRAVVAAELNQSIFEIWIIRPSIEEVVTRLGYIDQSYHDLSRTLLLMQSRLEDAKQRLARAPPEFAAPYEEFEAFLKATHPGDATFACHPALPPLTASTVNIQAAHPENGPDPTVLGSPNLCGITPASHQKASISSGDLQRSPRSSAEAHDSLPELSEDMCLTKVYSEPPTPVIVKDFATKVRSGSVNHMGRLLPARRTECGQRKHTM